MRSSIQSRPTGRTSRSSCRSTTRRRGAGVSRPSSQRGSGTSRTLPAGSPAPGPSRRRAGSAIASPGSPWGGRTGARTPAGGGRGWASRWANLPPRFAGIYTAAITDVMDELGLQRQTLPWAIQPLSADMRLAGYAFTARGRPYRGTPRDRDTTRRLFLRMLGAAPADSVLVLASGDNAAAHFGELSAQWFRSRRIRGAVIDGATRDAASIARLRFPTFVRYRTPQASVPPWRAPYLA